MEITKTALQYAEQLCATIMKTKAEDLPPKGRFHYHQGVFLLGMRMIYDQNQDERLYQYIKDWVDSIVDENGHISYMHAGELDDLQAGNLLLFLYEKTGEAKYKKALDGIIALLRNWSKNPEGGFWHKDIHPDQMWLDGIYMASPLMVRYAKRFGGEDLYREAETQTTLMNRYLRDEEDGLFFHGWDSSHKKHWSDPVTGRAPEKWSRAMGWYTMAMLEIMEEYPKDSEKRQLYIDSERAIIEALLKYQDEESGIFYNIINRPGEEGNRLEVSCACLYTYSICKGISMGVLDSALAENAEKMYRGVMRLMEETEAGDFLVTNVVCGTGIDDYAYYISVPFSTNDLHGAGAFLMMCSEYHKLFETEAGRKKINQ